MTMSIWRSLCVMGLLVSAASADETTKPNMVFVIADDLTWRDVGCYGGQAHTPNFDRLAKEGIRLTHCFQAAPMCSPTRHNIYTGLYPVKSGAYPNHTFVKDGVQSVAHYLKPLGYRVALAGKRHIGPMKAFPFEYLTKNKQLKMDVIERFMVSAQQAQQPFCLFVCSQEPHEPWNKGDSSRYEPDRLKLPPNWVDTPETRRNYSRYLAEVTYFDHQLGQVLDLLEQHQLTQRTLVMAVTEQGSSFPFAKWTLYDDGIRAGMVVRWPRKIKPGSVNHAMVEYVDICPTFIALAGGKPSSKLDGKSMLPVLLGETDQHKDYVYAMQTTNGIFNFLDPYGIRSIRSRDYKLIWNLMPENTFQNTTIRKPYFQSWKAKGEAGNARAAALAKRYQHRPQFELYDLRNDPYELTNLAERTEHAGTLADLRKRLEAWMKSQDDLGAQTELDARQRMKGGSKKGRPQPQ